MLPRVTNSTPEARLAIFAGIAAPAIISSLVSGASDAALHRKTASTFQHVAMMISRVGATIIQVANAEDKLNGDNLRPLGEGQIIPAQGQSTGPTLLVSSRVDGGNPSNSIPITVQIKNGEKFEIVTIGTLSAFNGVSAYSLPTGTTYIYMLGKTIPVSTGTITPANVVIKTKPSSVGDFLWSLGAPRACPKQGGGLNGGLPEMFLKSQ
jgi:hypothetical protein